MAALTPLKIAPLKSERLIMVDALRGFALMGLFIVHAVEYFELYWFKPEPGFIHDTIFFLFAGKMAATFALLFGVAVHTMLERYQNKGIDFRGRLVWRFVLLILFGYAHSLLYAGDILLHLGINGLLLVLLCRLPNGILVALMVFCFLQVPALFDFFATFSNPESATQTPKFWALSWRNFEVFAAAPFTDLVQYNAWLAYENKWVFNFETGKFWSFAGSMLAGLLLGRFHFFEKCQQKSFALGRWLIAAVFIAVSVYLLKDWGAAKVPEGMSRWYFTELSGNLFSTAMLIAGCLLFIQVYRYTPLQKLQNLLVPFGRMSLTLYLSQSIVCVPIFYGFGLGWYQKTTQLNSLLLGICLLALQIVFARLWFKGFLYGPIEWLWRALTLTRRDVPFVR